MEKNDRAEDPGLEELSLEPPDDASRSQTCYPTLARKKLRVRTEAGGKRWPGSSVSTQLTRQHRGDIRSNTFCRQLQPGAWKSKPPNPETSASRADADAGGGEVGLPFTAIVAQCADITGEGGNQSKAVWPSLAGCLLITLLRASRCAQRLLLLLAPPRRILGSVVSPS